MATVNDKIKKILAMIDGATTEGEARAASLALQRLLVANDMTLDEISLSDVACAPMPPLRLRTQTFLSAS